MEGKREQPEILFDLSKKELGRNLVTLILNMKKKEAKYQT